MTVCVHFVGFRGEEYNSAVKVFGEPDFYHRWWDRRAIGDVDEGDIVVFANGHESKPINPFSFDDSSVF